MTSFFRYKYHKLILLVATFVLAYWLFTFLPLSPFYDRIQQTGYVGTFIAGLLFSYGFTAAPATALFLILGQQQTWWLAALVGAIGSVVGNVLIFHFIRYSLDDEIYSLEREKPVRRFERAVPRKLKHFLVPVLAGFVMASPLPDEVAVSLLAFTYHITTRELIIVSWTLHFIGIALIVGAANLI